MFAGASSSLDRFPTRVLNQNEIQSWQVSLWKPVNIWFVGFFRSRLMTETLSEPYASYLRVHGTATVLNVKTASA